MQGEASNYFALYWILPDCSSIILLVYVLCHKMSQSFMSKLKVTVNSA